MRIREHIRQLASESMVYGLAPVVTRSLSMFLVPVYTRVFAPSDYGVIGQVNTVVALLITFVVLSLDTGAFRWFWNTEDETDRKTTISSWVWGQTFTSIAFGLLLVSLAPWLARTLTGRPEDSRLFVLCAVTLPFRTLGKVINNYFRMLRRPWSAISFTLFVTTLSILLAILFVVGLRMGLAGVYVAALVAQFISTIAGVLILRDWVSPTYFQLKRLREMLSYALPLVPTSLAFWVVRLSDRLIVGQYQDTTEVGLYQIGVSIASLVAIVVNAFQNAYSAFAFSIMHKPEAKKVYATVMEVFLLTTCFASLGITLFAPEALRVLTTEAYYPAYNVVGVLTLGYVMMALYQVSGLGSAIAKKTAPIGVAITIAAGVNIALSFLLIPSMGRMGAAISTLVSWAIVPIYLFWRSQQLYPIPYRFSVAIFVPVATFVLMTIGDKLSGLPYYFLIPARLALLVAFTSMALILRPVRVRLGLIFRRAIAKESNA